MKSLHPGCPAATIVEPPAHGTSVLCGVLELANDEADRGHVSALMSGRRSPTTVRAFCCGTGLPGARPRPGVEACYTECVVWRAQRDAEIAQRRELRDTAADRLRSQNLAPASELVAAQLGA